MPQGSRESFGLFFLTQHPQPDHVYPLSMMAGCFSAALRLVLLTSLDSSDHAYSKDGMPAQITDCTLHHTIATLDCAHDVYMHMRARRVVMASSNSTLAAALTLCVAQITLMSRVQPSSTYCSSDKVNTSPVFASAVPSRVGHAKNRGA